MKYTYVYILAIIIQFSCVQKDNKNPINPIEENANLSETETQIFNWFKNQQLPNGLLETVENGNIVSLYDQALAALVFIMNKDYTKAEKIFDFFNARIDSELKNGVGGFSMLRDKHGKPNNRRWMGDNAWLLIAINNYKQKTGKTTYNNLAAEITSWLKKLQDTDGGLWAGYGPDDNKLSYKVTEGNIDVFNAITGYNEFHKNLLNFLKKDRWNQKDKNLMAYLPEHKYTYAMDLHPWSYLIFNKYPISSLTSAERYKNTQTSTINKLKTTGYCFDVDNDAVWFEGTGQMALAFSKANMNKEKKIYLTEMEKNIIKSNIHPNSSGLTYASNKGSSFEHLPLWEGVDTKIHISGGAWYLFAKSNFNPFEIGHKNIPTSDMFWLN